MKTTQALKLGLWLTAVVFVLNLVMSKIGITVKELFAVTPISPITSTIGIKVIDALQKIIVFDAISLLMIFIGASLISLIGIWAIDTFKLPKGKTDWQRLFLTLIYGTIPFYLLLVGFGLPTVGTIIGLGIYIGVASLLATIFPKILNKLL